MTTEPEVIEMFLADDLATPAAPTLEDKLSELENEVARLHAFVLAWEARDGESLEEIERLKKQVAAQQKMLHARAPKA